MYRIERITINHGWLDTTPFGYERKYTPLIEHDILFESYSGHDAMDYWTDYCLSQPYQPEDFTECDIAQSYYRIIKVEE